MRGRLKQQTLQAILDEIATGVGVLKAITDHGVSPGKFYRMLDAEPDIAERYARAKATGLDRMALDTLRIADDLGIDADHKRIMVDTRKWMLAKLAPSKYGDRVTLAGDADNPIPLALSVDERMARIAAIADAARAKGTRLAVIDGTGGGPAALESIPGPAESGDRKSG